MKSIMTALEDRYHIEREIGRGGMATVYLARDIKHDRLVALKVLDPELGAVLGGDRFLSEIRVTANLQHPNLLPLFDSGSADGLLYYVMPYVEGESLRHRLDRERQLPVDEALRIAIAVAGALDYAHAHGVIHRDLKPENILLQHGQPIVADFGIALAVSNAGGQRVTQTGLSLGTPQYMSPEQATGDRVIDGRTDIYSLGALLYEMLAGEPPHIGATSQAVIAKLMTEAPRPVTVLRKAVPDHVDEVLQRALEKLPADRYSTAKEFAEALGKGPGAATTHPRAALAPRRSRARIAMLALPWLVAAALGAWIGVARHTDALVLQIARQLTFDGNVTGAALSPDGAWLAYVTDDCWGRATPCGFTLQTREVDGTQSVRITHWRKLDEQLVWSPDGSLVLFRGADDTTRTAWYLTSRLGGSTRRVPINAVAATFTPDGRLAMVAGAPGKQTLYRIDPVGLTVTDSTVLQRGLSVVGLAYRRRSPEIAMVTNSGSDDDADNTFTLMTSDGKIADTLQVPGRNWIKWSADESSALTMTFGPGLSDDLRAMRVRGDKWVRGEMPVALGQVQSGYIGCFDIARNGRTVIVFHQTAMEFRIAPLGASDPSAWKTITRRTGYLDARGVSPDNKLIAADATDNIGDNIYLFSLDSAATPHAVTAARGVREGPVWSPDGKRVAYNRWVNMLSRRDQSKLPPSGLVVTDAGGGRETLVWRGTGSITGYAWLSNATLVVAEAARLKIVDTTGAVRDSIALPDSIAGPTWLAADRNHGRLAYWSQRRHGLVVFDMQARKVLRVLPSEVELGTTGWTDDGSLILSAGRGINANLVRFSTELLRLPPDLGTPQRIQSLPPQCSRPSVTPDGKRVICTISDVRPDVWLADTPGKSGW